MNPIWCESSSNKSELSKTTYCNPIESYLTGSDWYLSIYIKTTSIKSVSIAIPMGWPKTAKLELSGKIWKYRLAKTSQAHHPSRSQLELKKFLRRYKVQFGFRPSWIPLHHFLGKKITSTMSTHVNPPNLISLVIIQGSYGHRTHVQSTLHYKSYIYI